MNAVGLDARAPWHSTLSELPPSPTAILTPTSAQVSDRLARASSLHADAVRAHQKNSSSNSLTSSSSDASFLQKVLLSGTLSDRLSALTLLIQSSPVHNTKALETLKSMVERGKGQGGREQSLKALRCIVDWWVGGGAPGRKLKFFREQPLLHPAITEEHLVLWFFEDWLKKYFFSLLQIIETLSLDPLPYVRTQALTFISTLLREAPEQEQNLLRLLVNKLGDNERTICSRASYYLLQLLQSHPSMKPVVVREMVSLVFRPTAPTPLTTPSGAKHIRFDSALPKTKGKEARDGRKESGNAHASYYATITFNQIVLTPSPSDRQVARQLIDVYFELFKDLLGDVASRGEELPSDGLLDEDGAPQKGAHRGKDGKRERKEAKGDAGFAEIEDSNSRHISAILTGVNRALPFAKLSPTDVKFNQHVNTLFLITHTSTFNISLQALLLILQISTSLNGTSGAIVDRYYRTLYASLHDSRLATSSKQAMYLNLVFKSLKADPNLERVAAFTRRFIQMLVTGGGGGPEFTAGGLYVVGELFSSVPGLRKALSACRKAEEPELVYDPRKRDPQYAHATALPMWELSPLLHHYHPTVALHARQLLLSQPLTAVADLSMNTLSHFLDRFVYKNPKKAKSKGSSAMQPAASASDGTGVKLMKGEVPDVAGLMNEQAFLRRKAQDIPVDQLFFHRYFTRKSEKEKARFAKSGKAKTDDDPSDDESEQLDDVGEESDAEEAEIWKAMKGSMPKMDGDEFALAGSDVDIDDDSDAGFDLNGTDAEEEDGEEDGDDDAAVDRDEDDQSDFSLAEGSDADDLVDLDADVPDGLIEYDGSDVSDGDDDAWDGIGAKKRKRDEETKSSGKKKKLRALGTFATYDQYARMIEDAPEEDL